MMIEEVYDALIESGASQEKARAAARAIAAYDKQFTEIDKEILSFRSEVSREFAHVQQEFADVRGTLKLHNWMIATNTAMLIALLFRVFSR